MIFITTGSRSFQFNRLLKAVDEAVEEGKITDQVFAQIGNSNYKINNYEYIDYLERDEFNKRLQECEVVVTHGGSGVIVNSAKLGKRVVAVPRLKKYNEMVDDHQIQLVKAFDKLGIVTPCWECTSTSISEAIKETYKKNFVAYKPNNANIINSIDEFIVQSAERKRK